MTAPPLSDADIPAPNDDMDMSERWKGTVGARRAAPVATPTDVEAWLDDPDARTTAPEGAATASEQNSRHGDSWKPVDLRDRLAAGYVKPIPMVGQVEGSEHPLLYPGRINALFGDSGSGKTWVAAMIMAMEILLGNDALLVDYEDQPETIVGRLEDLGVDLEAILDHLIYMHPDESWDIIAQGHMREALESRNVTIAVLDSTGEGMALDSVSSNSDDEVARWFRGAARTMASAGAAVLVLDHIAKGQPGVGRNTGFAIGSQRKRAAINGVSYYLAAVKAPSKVSDGLLQMIPTKDRHGTREKDVVAAEIEMKHEPQGAIAWSIKAPVVVANADGSIRLMGLMETLSWYLETLDAPASLSAIKAAKVTGSKYLTWVKTLELMVSEGYAVETPGRNGSRCFASVKPYREAEDPNAPGALEAGQQTDEPW